MRLLETALRAAITANPRNAQMYNKLGNMLYKEGNDVDGEERRPLDAERPFDGGEAHLLRAALPPGHSRCSLVHDCHAHATAEARRAARRRQRVRGHASEEDG